MSEAVPEFIPEPHPREGSGQLQGVLKLPLAEYERAEPLTVRLVLTYDGKPIFHDQQETASSLCQPEVVKDGFAFYPVSIDVPTGSPPSFIGENLYFTYQLELGLKHPDPSLRTALDVDVPARLLAVSNDAPKEQSKEVSTRRLGCFFLACGLPILFFGSLWEGFKGFALFGFVMATLALVVSIIMTTTLQVRARRFGEISVHYPDRIARGRRSTIIVNVNNKKPSPLATVRIEVLNREKITRPSTSGPSSSVYHNIEKFEFIYDTGGVLEPGEHRFEIPIELPYDARPTSGPYRVKLDWVLNIALESEKYPETNQSLDSITVS